MATPAIPRPGIEAALPTAPSQFAAASSDELELAERHLEHARAILAEREVEAEFVAEVGAPAERIVEIADERQADVLVVGTREPSFIKRLLEGSVSEDVARRTHRDIMIVH